MTEKNASMNNYVELVKLKTEKILQNNDLDIVLSDDIWGKSTLLVKSGGYLTEELINKLLNFGIKKVPVNFVEKDNAHSETLLTKEFLKTQCVLILENNVLNSAWLVRNLVDTGFSQGNIFVTSDYNSINQYFKIKKINFIFTGMSLYEKCQRVLNKYSLLRSTHAFVIMEKQETARKIKQNFLSGVKFLKKPLNAKVFSFLLNNALQENLLNLYVEEVSVS
ncbi:MAG TPA: hypothetical protein P5556_10280 [Candidatus Gastranaerophilales bacterium]|nr:hypothetical protein [Candidatus Gastranaerophilales bacterium]